MGISIFEIIGPIMIGPSSSHTAGMARIGMMANRIAGEEITAIHLELSPLLRTTYRGHRTDVALIGGAMGLTESDSELCNALHIAQSRGIETSVGFLPEGAQPQNSVCIHLHCISREITVLGTSVGGGSIVIRAVDGISMQVNPEAYHLFLWSAIPPVLPDGLPDCTVQSGKHAEEYVTCLTFSKLPETVWLERLAGCAAILKTSVVFPVLEYGVSLPTEKSYHSCAEVCADARREQCSLAEIALRYEQARSGFSAKDIRSRMLLYLQRMQRSVWQGQQENHLLYGLASGKDAKLLRDAIAENRTISGGIVPTAIASALGVMELNASMGCIVAAPTAGSSGIVPGCMTTVQATYGLTDEALVDALLVAGLMGVVMASREVSFSGSVGGCQGEVGVSAAISAAGMASLFTADTAAITHAMALCLKNLLGLVCDPIAGPIEIPCIKRNAVGVATAFASADMALAGIRSFIPPDEVIDALVDVERRLPQELKCATVGGLACTCTAKKARKALAADQN